MDAKYGAFFTNFKSIIEELQQVISTFYNTIKSFVDGFKKVVTVTDDEFTY